MGIFWCNFGLVLKAVSGAVFGAVLRPGVGWSGLGCDFKFVLIQGALERITMDLVLICLQESRISRRIKCYSR